MVTVVVVCDCCVVELGIILVIPKPTTAPIIRAIIPTINQFIENPPPDINGGYALGLTQHGGGIPHIYWELASMHRLTNWEDAYKNVFGSTYWQKFDEPGITGKFMSNITQQKKNIYQRIIKMDRISLISLIDLEQRSLEFHKLELEQLDKLIKPKKRVKQDRVSKYLNKR